MQGLKTAILLGTLTALLLLVGGLIGGEAGLIVALIFAAIMNMGAYWYSDVVAVKMTRSQPLAEHQAPEAYRITRRLCQRAGLPMPKLYVTPSDQPNAFATGRNPKNAVVAVTRGLLTQLDEEELEGVIAHELAHVENRDILISSVAATIAGAISMLAIMGRWTLFLGGGRGGRDNPLALVGLLVAVIVVPIAAAVIQMAISRSREFVADAGAARIAGSSRGLIRALETLERSARARPMQVSESAAHMFIINPLGGRGGASFMAGLFSTHPPVAERIRRLQQLG